MTLYSVAGLNTQIELPVPLIVRLIPVTQTRQRPGLIRQTPGAWVQHETGNFNGAEGQTRSYHFTVDDKEVYQMIPVNEVTWQAADGSGPGNMAGVSCELCVNTDSDWTKARKNAEVLAGRVSKALGITKITRHYDYNVGDPDRHFCPKEMMSSGYWPTFVLNATSFITGNTTQYAEPITYPWLQPTELAEGIDRPMGNTTAKACRRLWEVKTKTPRRRQATLSTAISNKVGPDLMPGDTFMGEFIFKTTKGWWVLTQFGTRIFMADLTETASIV
jgi:hypothetical protein